jgi:bifunctional DNase/RNase
MTDAERFVGPRVVRRLVAGWAGAFLVCAACAGSSATPPAPAETSTTPADGATEAAVLLPAPAEEPPAPDPPAPVDVPPATPGDGAAPTVPHAPAVELLPAEISTLGWDGLTDTPVVLLRELASGKVVPIWVGAAEARAIALALHGIEPPRPMTHDLMRNLIADLGAKLLEVWVTELRGDTYYGLLQLAVKGSAEPLLVDTRPSDALALALRTGAPIRLAKQIVDQTPQLDFLAPEPSDQVVRAAGLTVKAVSAELRRDHDLPDRPGIVVVAVDAQAAASGLRAGDLVLAFDGSPAATPIALLDAVRRAVPGQPLRVTYWREGEEHVAELRVGAEQKPLGTPV